MLAAIGIILILKQIPLALGYDKPDFWRVSFVHIISSENFLEKYSKFNQETTMATIVITLLSLAMMFLLQQPVAKRLRVLPAPLIVVIMGVLINIILARLASAYSLKHTQLVNIPSNIFSAVSFPDLSKLLTKTEIWKDGVIIGILATLETLLCVEAIDKLDRHNRITPVNRELIAQGIGNMTCGFLGAIPMTAVVVRVLPMWTPVQERNLSAFTHGLFLLLAVLLAPFLLNMIPYALPCSHPFNDWFQSDKAKIVQKYVVVRVETNLFLSSLQFLVISETDLLIGVSIGLLISTYFIIRNNFKAEYKVTKTSVNETEIYYIKLNTNVTFLNKVNLRKALDKIPEYSELTVDGSECNFIDYDILEIISEYENKAMDRNIKVYLKGIQKVNVTAVH